MPIINSSHKQVVQSITNMHSDLIKNPYYLFNDKKANIVDYYNINTMRSTLDQSLKIAYSTLGESSPLRFNLIKGFYLYGLERISVNLENGDFGLESSDITGDAIILPNTIKPYAGDYFTINMVSKKYLFKIISATPDTLDDGANYWRVEYKLEWLDDENVRKLTVEEFEFVTGNVGSNFNSIVKKSKYDVAKEIDDRAVQLKLFYKSLYYNNKVQTYTFVHQYLVTQDGLNSDFFYDPYMIEFVIRNKVLANDGDKYTYIGHKTTITPEFPIRYSKSIWRVLESKELNNLDSCTIETYGTYIWDPATIFKTRFENYFELTYSKTNPMFQSSSPPIQIFDPQVIGHIKEKQLFDYDSKYSIYNVIIKYMNNMEFTIEDIIQYDKIQEYDMTEQNYFLIPMIIFCMEYEIKRLLAKTS